MIENGGPDQKSAILGYFWQFFWPFKIIFEHIQIWIYMFLDVKLTEDYDSDVILLKQIRFYSWKLATSSWSWSSTNPQKSQDKPEIENSTQAADGDVYRTPLQ